MKSEFVIARVKNGRLVLDEPTDLPEGSEVSLVIADPSALVDPLERPKLNAALEQSEREMAQGKMRDGREVIAEARRKRT